jgi:hypothetical protein
MSSNPAHGEVYLIQHYVKFVSDLCQVSVFFPVSSTNKTDSHDITEILLKVALNTITLTYPIGQPRICIVEFYYINPWANIDKK